LLNASAAAIFRFSRDASDSGLMQRLKAGWLRAMGCSAFVPVRGIPARLLADSDFTWGSDADLHLVPLDRQDGHDNSVINHQTFINPSRQDKHGSPCYLAEHIEQAER
jgi:hypothetical protein